MENRDFVEHSGRLGSIMINKDGAELILAVLRGKNEVQLTGKTEAGKTYQMSVRKNEFGDHAGMLDRKRYAPEGRDVSYSVEVWGYEHVDYPDRNDFAMAVSVMEKVGVVIGANIIKVRDPGYTRNPYSGRVTSSDEERALDIFDIKRGGNEQFARDLANFCLGECAAELQRNPPRPDRP